jgi:hypothetical protein
MQQSAVKWLEDQIKSKHWKEMFIWQKEEVFKKAKEMFEEQIIDAFEAAEKDCGKDFLHGDLYYNETFNK